jgi:hypothetical protein
LQEPVIGKKVKSAFSGKDLWITYDHYSENSKFFDYVHEHEKLPTPKLKVDEIKDIDSLFGAVREQLIYSGNKTLGISESVENSDHVSDSSYVLNSSIVIKSKFIAYCYLKRNTEYAFASTSTGNSSYVMRCFNATYLKRCFECSDAANSADLYFCYNLMGCNNCMFSFNLRNKSNVIGNIPLEREQYSELRKKLLSEMADELKKNKRLDYSIINLFGNGARA